MKGLTKLNTVLSCKIYNVAITDADTEYSQALPKGTKKVLLKLRSGVAALKLAYTVNESGTNYITIPVGSTKYLEGVWLSNFTLYFQSPNAAQVLEVEIWQ